MVGDTKPFADSHEAMVPFADSLFGGVSDRPCGIYCHDIPAEEPSLYINQLKRNSKLYQYGSRNRE